MSFLWENANVNLAMLRYEQADLTLRNLLEMAVVSNNTPAVALAL
jgi:hypothetical protein